MTVCSDQILMVAENLMLAGDEASVRSAISRSYYAVYHEAKATAHLLDLPDVIDVKTSHDKLIERFNRSSLDFKALARTMRRQKKLRAFADYDIQLEMDVAEAQLHLASSKLLLTKLRKLGAMGRLAI